MKTLHNVLGAALCVASLCAPAVWAQQQAPDQTQQQAPSDQGATQPSGPIPAYRSPLASAANNDEPDAQTLAPDNRPLAGAQNLSLGIETTHSYWQPHVDVFATANSNALATPQASGWSGGGSVAGGVDIHRLTGNSNLDLSYTSGGVFSNQTGVTNGVVQAFVFSDKFSFRRWALSFFDQLSYLPGSAFGFAGLGGTLAGGAGQGGLGPGLGTGQGVLIGQGQSLGNSFATEVDTFLTSRSSLTFVGDYSLLHYTRSDLLDSGNANFRVGYNHQLNRKDTIAVFYTFSSFRYSNFNQSINLNTVQFSYGRQITGQLAFQVAGGPQVVISRLPIAPASDATSATSATQLYFALNAALQWQVGRNQLGLAYTRGTNAGSGVLAGSDANTVTGSVVRKMSRTFSSGFTGGYSRNQGTAIGTGAPAGQTFDTWFGSGTLAHPVGQSLGLTLTYQVQYQTSSTRFCTGPACGTSFLVNWISFGIGWHERPLLF